jgi:non-heme chloroperoxidase
MVPVDNPHEHSPFRKGAAMAQDIGVASVTLSVEDEGIGPVVVFIHGWCCSGRFSQRQLPYFARTHRVIIPDLRGHGRSEKTLSGHTVPQYAADLQTLFGLLSVERPVLVGWSMGAEVAWEYLRAYGPGSVAGLVIVDQSPCDFAWEGSQLGGMTPEGLRQVCEQLQTNQAVAVGEFCPAMLSDPDESTVAWMAEELMQVPPVIATTILTDEALRDYREFLPRITVPTLVIFGEQDKFYSPKVAQYIVQQIPGARLQMFPRSSHCPFWEESDAFNSAIAEFVDEVAR